MVIERNDLVTFDDDQAYLVVSKMMNGFLEYYYLINKDNVSDYKFCYLDGDDMVEVLNEKSIADLTILFGLNTAIN